MSTDHIPPGLRARTVATTAAVPLSKLRVPTAFAIGKYELVSDEELEEIIADITAEQEKRQS